MESKASKPNTQGPLVPAPVETKPKDLTRDVRAPNELQLGVSFTHPRRNHRVGGLIAQIRVFGGGEEGVPKRGCDWLAV